MGLVPPERTNTARVRSFPGEDGGRIELELNPLQIAPPDQRFVADDCDVVVGEESVGLHFIQLVRPDAPAVSSVVSVRMRRPHAIALVSTFSAEFRRVLDAVIGKARSGAPEFSKDDIVHCVLAEYAIARISSADGFVRFYRFDEIAPGVDSVKLYALVQIDAFPTAMRRLVDGLTAGLAGDTF